MCTQRHTDKQQQQQEEEEEDEEKAEHEVRQGGSRSIKAGAQPAFLSWVGCCHPQGAAGAHHKTQTPDAGNIPGIDVCWRFAWVLWSQTLT